MNLLVKWFSTSGHSQTSRSAGIDRRRRRHLPVGRRRDQKRRHNFANVGSSR